MRFVGKFANAVGYKSSAAAKAGQTFVREHVAEVANPRTYAQAVQRAKMRPASLFYAAFEQVLNHAFLPDGSAGKNRNEFMKYALKLNEIPDVYKGENKLPVLPYVISRGSLGLSSLTIATPGRMENDTYFIGFRNLKAKTDSQLDWLNSTVAEVSQELISKNIGLADGMELTFLVIMGDRSDSSQRLPFICSFVLDQKDTITTIASVFAGSRIFISATSGYVEITSGGGAYEILAAGLVISAKTSRSWIYTNSELGLSTYYIDGFDTDEEEVVRSYMDAATSRGSDKILQQADNSLENNVGVSTIDNQKFTLSPAIEGATFNHDNAALATMTNSARKVVVNSNGQLLYFDDERGVLVPVTKSVDGATTPVMLSETTWAGNPTILDTKTGF